MSVETGEQYVTLGRISGLHGVKGWVKVFSYTRPRENILSYSPWYLKLDGHWQAVELLQGKRHGDTIVAHLQGYDDRDHARQLQDIKVAIKRQQLPELDEGYYWTDLQGMQVVTSQGVDLGQVDYLLETGANDVLVVKQTGPEGKPVERLIPFIREDVIVCVDLSSRVITVDWDPDF